MAPWIFAPITSMGGVYLPLLLRMGLDTWLATADGMSENIRQAETHKLCLRGWVCPLHSFHSPWEQCAYPGGWEAHSKSRANPQPQAKPRQAWPRSAGPCQLQVCEWEISACFCIPVRPGGCLLCSNIMAHVDWDKHIRKGLGFWAIQFWHKKGSSFSFANAKLN